MIQKLPPPIIIPIWEQDGHNRASDASEALEASEPSSLRALHAPDALEDSDSLARVTSLESAARLAQLKGFGENSMWEFARWLKAFERDTKAKVELDNALSVWWHSAAARRELVQADFDEYLADLVDCFSRVKAPAGSNPLENAIKSAPALCATPSFSERLTRLIAVCEYLQDFAGKEPFYLSMRDAGRVLGTADPYAAKKAIALLVARKTLAVVDKGGPKTQKATRYRFVRQ